MTPEMNQEEAPVVMEAMNEVSATVAIANAAAVVDSAAMDVDADTQKSEQEAETAEATGEGLGSSPEAVISSSNDPSGTDQELSPTVENESTPRDSVSTPAATPEPNAPPTPASPPSDTPKNAITPDSESSSLFGVEPEAATNAEGKKGPGEGNDPMSATDQSKAEADCGDGGDDASSVPTKPSDPAVEVSPPPAVKATPAKAGGPKSEQCSPADRRELTHGWRFPSPARVRPETKTKEPKSKATSTPVVPPPAPGIPERAGTPRRLVGRPAGPRAPLATTPSRDGPTPPTAKSKPVFTPDPNISQKENMKKWKSQGRPNNVEQVQRQKMKEDANLNNLTPEQRRLSFSGNGSQKKILNPGLCNSSGRDSVGEILGSNGRGGGESSGLRGGRTVRTVPAGVGRGSGSSGAKKGQRKAPAIGSGARGSSSGGGEGRGKGRGK